MDVFRPSPEMRVLDVGVTSDKAHPESNYFEKLYPYPDRITCVGTEDGSHLEHEYPGLKYLRIQPEQPLPFVANEFDIVFSNAVVEHVGSRQAQARFLQEVCRVGKSCFVTTPNRWFPVEHHTGLPIIHFLPARTFRSLIRRSRYEFWSTESTLNLLTGRQFADMFSPGVNVKVKKIRVIGMASNLIAYGNTSGYNG